MVSNIEKICAYDYEVSFIQNFEIISDFDFCLSQSNISGLLTRPGCCSRIKNLRYKTSDITAVQALLELRNQCMHVMHNQLEFQRCYLELGVHGATWQDANVCIEKAKSLLIHPSVTLMTDNLPMIFADQSH